MKKYFKPIIDESVRKKVRHIVFLSVQGVEKSTIIPHHKIEKLIVASGIRYTFMRPAYFMQNFTTTLRNDIQKANMIYLPAGKARFTLVDVADVGRATAAVLCHPDDHINKAYDLTNSECLSFSDMAKMLSRTLGRKIDFFSPSLISFYLRKRKEQVPPMLILVMIMLHYLPRFQQTPRQSPWIERITGTAPRTFEDFLNGHRHLFT